MLHRSPSAQKGIVPYEPTNQEAIELSYFDSLFVKRIVHRYTTIKTVLRVLHLFIFINLTTMMMYCLSVQKMENTNVDLQKVRHTKGAEEGHSLRVHVLVIVYSIL